MEKDKLTREQVAREGDILINRLTEFVYKVYEVENSHIELEGIGKELLMGKELLREANEWHWELCNILVSSDLSEEMKSHTRKYRDVLSVLIKKAEQVQELEEENKRYLEWLEQIEQVQELEEHLRIAHQFNKKEREINQKIRKENKRYRESLEAIAYFEDKDEGEVATRIDVKNIARQALEGEE